MIDLFQSSPEERETYMRLYAALQDDPYWPCAAFVDDTLDIVLERGHAEPVYEGEDLVGYRMTQTGKALWEGYVWAYNKGKPLRSVRKVKDRPDSKTPCTIQALTIMEDGEWHDGSTLMQDANKSWIHTIRARLIKHRHAEAKMIGRRLHLRMLPAGQDYLDEYRAKDGVKS